MNPLCYDYLHISSKNTIKNGNVMSMEHETNLIYLILFCFTTPSPQKMFPEI
uniref:Uncharacterized protein n=1 Tax=Anguilla anguilla TaxID=7936 RepID=A0A0E9WAV1_ANGAN